MPRGRKLPHRQHKKPKSARKGKPEAKNPVDAQRTQVHSSLAKAEQSLKPLKKGSPEAKELMRKIARLKNELHRLNKQHNRNK